MKNCLFCKIRDGEIEKEFTYQDKYVMAFPDINPMRPIHLLVVAKNHIEDLMDVDDTKLWNQILVIVKKLIKENKLANKGYRITINGGGAQLINHLHVHISGPIEKDLKI